MKLESEFFKLPLLFDAERMASEISGFAESVWRPHPQGHAGNSYLPLVSVDGGLVDDGMAGAMKPTPHLDRTPYLRQVIASLNTVVGRSRLMRIEGNAEAVAHIDIGYYWSQRVRVHIPILTYPAVRFQCGGREVHMAAGECWIFDTWRMHNVINGDPRSRVHLVVDTVGSAAFWDLVDGAERPFLPNPQARPPRTIPFEPDREATFSLETVNFPLVMSPWEIQCQLGGILDELALQSPDVGLLQELRRRFILFLREWRGLWAEWGEHPTPSHEEVINRFNRGLDDPCGELRLPNGYHAAAAVRMQVVIPALRKPNTGLSEYSLK